MSETDKLRKVLLIVDNSLFIIERLLSILKEANAVDEILTATNYSGAVEVLHKTRTDIVLLDIQLAEKNGIELLKYTVHHFPEIKVVIVSNLISDYYQKLCKAAGAFCFIDKSRDFDKITEVVFSI